MWQPVDTQFFAPQTPVSIVCLPDSGGRGAEFRTLLESLGCVVLMHQVGTPSDFLQVIAQRENAPRYLIIVGHGSPEGLYFGEYASGLGIDISMLQNEYLPPETVGEHAQLAGTTIIADVCYGATPELVRAFLSRGAKAYIASDEALGVELSVFLVNFFYRVLERKEADHLAVEGAINATGPEVESVGYFPSPVLSSTKA